MAQSSPLLHLHAGDALEQYDIWPTPTVIISDGAYGVGSFPGDPENVHELIDWYRPHVIRWTEHASPQTTLWFWGTELSWATVHPLLIEYGWRYKAASIWDKGIAHVAGNTNTNTLTHLPIVTEMCVQYTREPVWSNRAGDRQMTTQEWLRQEWQRTGLPLSEADTACGVKNAASRKYLSADHQWYFPPGEMMARLAEYANQHGDPAGRPYFDLSAFAQEGENHIGTTWERLRAKFFCPIGITNVWHTPAVRGAERVKKNGKAVHMNQKPLSLIRLLIIMSSEPGDVVWDAFGGLFTTAIACYNTGRRCYTAEVHPETFAVGLKRVRSLCPGEPSTDPLP